jgi:hypothetical protein
MNDGRVPTLTQSPVTNTHSFLSLHSLHRLYGTLLAQGGDFEPDSRYATNDKRWTSTNPVTNPHIFALSLHSCTGQEKPDYEGTKPKYKKSIDKKDGMFFGVHRAALTIQVQLVLFARVDFRQFPFDHQTLELSLKLSSIRVPGVKKGTRPTARHPQRWRGASDPKEGGHTLVKDCDCLPEYDLVRLCSRAYSSAYGPFIDEADKDKYEKDKAKGTLYQDGKTMNHHEVFHVKKCHTVTGTLTHVHLMLFFPCSCLSIFFSSHALYIKEYTLQIIMVRDSVSVMWNMCFSLFVIDVMVFAAHGIPMADLADRLSVNLTLLLTAMAFKWVLSDQLPPVPYLTTMEIYVIATFACLWLQGLAFWFLADMYNYRCEGKIDYWTAEAFANKTVTGLDATCELLQQVDRSVLMVEVAALVGKNVWFLYRVAVNRKAKVMKETHYQNLGILAEFSMAKDMRFIGDGEMDGIAALDCVATHNEGVATLYGGVGGGSGNISSRNVAQVAPVGN